MRARLGLLTGLALWVAAGLVSCGKPAEEPPAPDTGTSAPTNEVTPTAEAGGGAAMKLVGAGATFPAPLYSKWCKDFTAGHPDVQVDYQSTGSGNGVKSFIDRTVDFGASDAAMTNEEIGQVDVGAQLLPMTAGSIVLAYNLDGVPELKLSRKAYVGIYLGTVTKWNDAAITADNPGVPLPDTAITVVERSDGSGTSFVFSQHLAAVSPEFEQKVGANKLPNWPVGIKSKGNEGVAASVQTTPGSIGYVEYGYAENQHMPFATLENRAGKFVAASPDSSKAALAAVELPENLIAWVPDPEGEDCYPIVSYTWVMVYKKYDDPAQWSALKDFLMYALTDGQKDADPLGYVPLPDRVVAQSKAALEKVTAGA